MQIRTRQPFIAILLTACLGFGFSQGANAGAQDDATQMTSSGGDTLEAEGENDEQSEPLAESAEPLVVFAEKTFYLERPEPVEVIVGVLHATPVRVGPNTRDMPLKLTVGTEELGVYVAGFDHAILRPYVGNEVEIVGKRIDQSAENYGVEIWIGTINKRKP